MDLTLVPLIDPNSEIQGIIIITNDMTEDKKLREDLKKSNEDLQTANEKLETTNEELVSAPAAEKMFGIKEEDALGSNFFALKTDPCFRTGELVPKIRHIIENTEDYHERNLECSTSSGEKKYLVLTIVPMIDITRESLGTMLISRDVTKERRAEEAVLEGIVETAREPLVILNGKLKVKKANQAFYRTFEVSPGETENKFIYDLGNRQWDIPRLRELLEEIIPRSAVIEDYEVEHEFPTIGKKKMLLNAHRIYRKGSTEMILLAIEDAT